MIGLFAAQTLFRAGTMLAPQQKLPLLVLSTHLLDLAALTATAILALRFAKSRHWLQAAIALALASVGMLLLAFDIASFGAVQFHQRVPPLATVPLFYCNSESPTGCIRPFPLTSLAIVSLWLLWAVLIFYAANALAWLSRLLPIWLVAAFVLFAAASWMLFTPHFATFEPLVRFMGKGGLGAEPKALALIPRPDYRVAPSPNIKPRPIILIVVDSLRADQVANMPFLRSLAGTGKLHDLGPAVAICQTSYCGITGILSSSDWATLQKGPPLTLPDVFAANGYQTHYLLTGPHIRALNLGKLYGPNVTTIQDDSSDDSKGFIDDRDQVRRLSKLRLTNPQRSFIFIHLMSAHGAGLRFQTGAPRAVKDDYAAFYKAGVTQADDIIRQLFAVLQSRGLLDTALVLISADHGERLEDPVGHGGAPDLSTAMVPLLIYDPLSGKWPAAGINLASHVDIAPTLLNAAGIVRPGPWRGMPLQSGIIHSTAPSDSAKFSGLISRIDGQPVMIRCDRKSGKVRTFGTALVPEETQRTFVKWSAGWPRRNDVKRCSSG